ncbi:BREX-3 system P-loop-containing protein BrxF [Sphaerochaeta halotolerans]|jgi:ABC-type lipoprotein export system ATPase subunit|uniref:BREX-3 system P-loop-containing protein BrxF n=1 Tax=Sphaerochaeta halotolerans TaxID=2293840 RepID=A0A372MJF5_9SPIR|nr:BREX-3 system P-loop-containing protein BrxF [Sphaerochaeta halotolerans]RFU95874.1 BREX-3 system P-loop-containing protein BrxF [Sphaerochaeta halotolerans]
MSITDSQLQTIFSSLKTAKDMYHQLILVVGPSGSGKTGILKQIAEKEKTSVINVNLEISSRLLELTRKQRKTKLQTIFNDIVDQAQAPVILDNLEILFDIELEQDPLRLLQHASRNTLILASWNGILQGKKLIYAEITHPEYRVYETSDTVTIDIDNA